MIPYSGRNYSVTYQHGSGVRKPICHARDAWQSVVTFSRVETMCERLTLLVGGETPVYGRLGQYSEGQCWDPRPTRPDPAGAVDLCRIDDKAAVWQTATYRTWQARPALTRARHAARRRTSVEFHGGRYQQSSDGGDKDDDWQLQPGLHSAPPATNASSSPIRSLAPTNNGHFWRAS